MANTTAMCTSFKVDLLNAVHAFSTSVPAHTAGTADTFKAALYFTTASLGATTTAYSTTGEVTNTSGTGYTAGGYPITTGSPPWVAPTSSSTTAYTTPSNSFSWTSLTITTAFDTVLIYNSSQSNKAVSVHNFGSQTVNNGTFTLTMPTNAAGTALLNIS